MIYTLPLRLTILHLAQRFRIDGETFISNLLAYNHSRLQKQVAKGLIIYFHSSFVQITRTFAWIIGQSGLEDLLR